MSETWVQQENMVCAACGIPFCMPASKVTELRRTHERFYCPNGHHLAFRGRSAEERRIAQLEKQVETWIGWHSDMVVQRDQARQAAKVCPYECGFVVKRRSALRNIRFALVEHLHEVHGAELAVEGELVVGQGRRELTA